MIQPIITIITAAFRLEGLKQAIKSIDAQTYKNWHHIIVNDNQSDIREWARGQKFGNNRHYIDLGVRCHWYGAIARNVGTVVAFTYFNKREYGNEWICYHDDDNLWHLNHLETLVRGLNEMPEATIVGVDCEIRGKVRKYFRHIRKLSFSPQNVDIGQLIYRLDLFKKYGYWNPCPEHRITWDYELIDRMARGEKGKIKTINKHTFIFFHRRR